MWSLGSRVSCSSSGCACVLPDGTTCDFIGKDAKRPATQMQKFHSRCLRRPERPLPMFVHGALEFLQRHQALDITSKLHLSVVTVANLEAHSRLERSIRHHLCSILSPSLSALLECIRSHFSHVARTDPAELGVHSRTRGLLVLRPHKSLDVAERRRRRGIVAKLYLESSLEIRELQAATFVTYLVPKENELVQATMDAMKAYADSVEEANKISNERERQSKLQLVGAAHAHHWAAVVRMAGASISPKEEQRAQMVAHISTISTPAQVTEIIHVSKFQESIRQTADQDALCGCGVRQQHPGPRRESSCVDQSQDEEGTTTTCRTRARTSRVSI